VDEQKGLTRDLVRKIGRTYATYSRVISNTLRPFAAMRAGKGQDRKARARIREIVRRLDVMAVKWARASVSRAYMAKRKAIASAARSLGNLDNPGKGTGAAEAVRLEKRTAEQFVKANATIMETANAFLDAYVKATQGVEAARARTREEVQSMSGDMGREMERKVAYYLARGYDEGSIARKLRHYLEGLAAGGDFIEVGGKFYAIKTYAEMVARSELHNAYVEATVDECKKWENDLVQFSQHDSPCEICRPLEGMVFSISGNDPEYPALDEPVLVDVGGKTVEVDPRFPHPNCCLPGTICEPIGDIAAWSRSVFNGKKIDLTLANGARLSVTENHLLLTPEGFSPANLLRNGDDIFYCPFNSRMVATDPNNYWEPSLIDEIVKTLAKANGLRSRRMKVAAEDFHGDGKAIEGDIDIIWADSFLVNAWEASFLKPINKDELHDGGAAAPLFPGSGDFASVIKRMAFASDRIVGGRRAPSPFFLARATGRNDVAFTNGAEDAANIFQPGVNGLIAQAETLRKIALQSPRIIEVQKVAAVNSSSYHGPVYDIQTSSTLYLADGILSSNCEHNLNPVTRNILKAAGG